MTKENIRYIEAYNDTIDNVVKLVDRLKDLSLSSKAIAEGYEELKEPKEKAFFDGIARGYAGARSYALDMYEASKRKVRWRPPVQISRVMSKDDCKSIEGAEWVQEHGYCAVRL